MNDRNNTKLIALGGILAALTVIILYIAAIIPNITVVLYGLSSIPIAIMVLEGNKKFGVIFYLTTLVLGLIVVPDKVIILVYGVVLGLYGIVKSMAEKGNNRILEWVMKLGYLNLTVLVIYVVTVNVLMISFILPLPIWLLWIPLQVVFVIYDIIYSQFIYYYVELISPKIKVNNREEFR